jgi:hypothetical protein
MTNVARALMLAGLLLSTSAGCGGGVAGSPGVGFLDDSGGRDAGGGPPDAAAPDEVGGRDAPRPDGAGPPPPCERHGQRCDDGDPCTVDDRCVAGVCAGDRISCDDRDPCTDDGCAPDVGCFHEPGTGATCDDGNGCTREDRCLDGVCTGAPDPLLCRCARDADCARWEDGDRCNGALVCVDGACAVDPASVVVCPATVIACRESRCVPQTGACTTADAPDGTYCDEGLTCVVQAVCRAGACLGAPLACDDRNVCTDDACTEAEGCTYTPNRVPCDDGDPATVGERCDDGVCRAPTEPCDDGTPCTVDSVDPRDGRCVHDASAANGTPCDDGDPWTGHDVCQDGRCVGQPAFCGERACDDGDPCTDDTCAHGVCAHAYNTAPCDDGLACTTGDRCTAGRCGGDETGCAPCTPAFGTAVQRLTVLAIGADGREDQALDVDGDPQTCAPAGACSGGRDNALAPLAARLNDALAAAVADGDLVWLLELPSWPVPLGEFSVNLYTNAALAPESQGCDLRAPGCRYQVSPLELDPTCRAWGHIDGVTYGGRRLLGGGPGRDLVLRLALAGGGVTDLPIEDVRLDVRVHLRADGDVRLVGLLGGVVWLPALERALAALPPGPLVPPAEVIGALVVPDVDRDGDGRPESASLGLRFETVAAAIAPSGATGVATCLDVVECAQVCGEGDGACTLACFASGDAEAQTLFLALLDCIELFCPVPTEACVESRCWAEAIDCWRDT